jgi:hypothetical protein
MEQMWKTFPEFKSAKASYNQFKKEILVHYSDAAGDSIYLLHDMDILIGERYWKGIMTSADLSDYYLQFVKARNHRTTTGICLSFSAATTFLHYKPPPAQISRSPSEYTLQNRTHL